MDPMDLEGSATTSQFNWFQPTVTLAVAFLGDWAIIWTASGWAMRIMN